MMDSFDNLRPVGRVFGTPVVVKGQTWIPLIQLAVWPVMAWLAGKDRTDRTWPERFGVGALSMVAVLGSEWCHNLAHAAAAQLVDQPMDALRVYFGMPLIIYRDLDDEEVTPRQHVVRALGGPVLNAGLLSAAALWRRLARAGSAAHDVAEAAVKMNAFLCTVSLLPIPGIDGGPLLKWSLVERGYEPAQADETVRKASGVTGLALGVASGAAAKKRRWFLAALLGLLSLVGVSVGLGWLKEKSPGMEL
jgi:Zn-dependent protease